ncbi:sulfate transporter [Thalassobaculum fulvum]|uniref:Sulfate transporter n=1 Tax=Thalassobaculum fulvum TaxID=1633335 RepID=A0A918XXE8_9PROT|nr:MlaE family lipid ABC transporter permease subunit [Thalassobaculum fulvum]GHD63757.1 sulfate transporter [Thalassobaculum fulvum]
MRAATIDRAGAEAAGTLSVDSRGDALVVRLAGAWTLETALAVDAALRELAERQVRGATFDATAVTRLDSAGAWAIRRTAGRLERRGVSVEVAGLGEGLRAIFDKAALHDPTAAVEPPPRWSLLDQLEALGRRSSEGLRTGRSLLGLLGQVVVALGRVVLRPTRLRGTATVAQIEATGVTALPIVGLLCFLVGVVLAYMGALQLARFGAAVLTVNLVGISVLREIGILLTAIIVAGRSGSAFAAQIGTMKVNQEVDALETMGLSVVDVLVLPRVVALVIVLPALTVFADVAGLAGGAVICLFQLDLSTGQFLSQLAAGVTIWSFLVGLIKAPFFAVVIALVGCHNGLAVSGSAESVGRQTTRAVVESIFLVIVLNAIFAIAFAEIGI